MLSSKRYKTYFYRQILFSIDDGFNSQSFDKSEETMKIAAKNSLADYHSIQLTAVVMKMAILSWKTILATFYALTGYGGWAI